MNLQPVKACTSCRSVKSLDSFAKWSRGPDGLKQQCRTCTKMTSAARYQAKKAGAVFDMSEVRKAQAAKVKATRVWKFKQQKTKACAKCCIEKPMAEFRRQSGRVQHYSVCLACESDYRKGYYQENQAACVARSVAWNREHLPKMSEMRDVWPSASLDALRAKEAKRRKYARDSTEHHTADDIADLMLRQKGKCAVCKDTLDAYHVDHVVPLVAGGSNGKLNIQILCPSCNLSKGRKDPIAFMQARGLLL